MEYLFIKQNAIKDFLEYEPYFKEDFENEDYKIFDINQKLKNIDASNLTDLACRKVIDHNILKNSLGLNSNQLYGGRKLGCDILLVWAPSKKQEPNRKKTLSNT